MNEAREKRKFDVFLSHNSKDKPAVRALAALLSEQGIKVWLDEDQLIPGRPWQPLLEKGIEESTAGAVLVGADGWGPWENEEMYGQLRLAVEEGKPVIPVLLPGVPEEPRLPLFLSTRTWVDLRAGFRAEEMDRLIWGITGEPAGRKPTARRGSEPIVSVTHLRHGAEHLVGREMELARLDTVWHDPRTHVVTIVAWGGVGKTALVVGWMARMARDGWRGAERVFDWSFYSQGTSATTAASADAFIAKALDFFGDPAMAKSPASPWDKGERLAHLVADHKALLVLDGVEPLQYPPGPVGGKLKDLALEALLKGLAQQNAGLCIATTREPVADLASFCDTTASQWSLEHLSEEAGAQLLFDTGVRRASHMMIRPDDQELKDASREVAGHALTLRLLGNYLRLAYNGDIRKREVVAFDEAEAQFKTNPADADKTYGHAFKVMAACQRQLARGGEEGKRQLAVLHLLGLFDRPADADSLAALRRRPVIDGLTEPIISLSEAQWNIAISRLQECGMVSLRRNDVSPVASSPSLDAHPLVREYFAQQLRAQSLRAWQSAHIRLYQYMCAAAPDLPDDYPAMAPLLQAFAHGCLAGEHRECLDEVYRRRIERGRQHYLTNALGAISTEIYLLGFLFKKRWTETADTIQGERQVYVFRQTGLAFRALGDLDAAAAHLATAVELSQRINDRDSEVNSCRHLAQTLTTAGRLQEACARAQQAVDRTDPGVNQFDVVAAWAGLGHVLHQLGDPDAAIGCFEQAELLLNQDECGNKHLSSLQGLRYCELLLERGNYDEVLQRTEIVSHREDRANFRAAQALGRVMRAKALYLTRINPADLSKQSAEIPPMLDEGLTALRNAGQREFYVFGLLCRADLRAHEGNAAGAQTDLDEAWEMAKRGTMKLHMADIHLCRARLFGPRQKELAYPWGSPQADLAAARELIEQCGYHRRDEELADAEEAAKGW
jgi:tetratricopeptide (TPR) repeat protein